jgi:hypothetical protein
MRYLCTMIAPHPTSKIDPVLARGTLLGVHAASATKPAHITFGVPNTNYELHLVPQGTIKAQVGKRLIGTIRAQARRIDVVQTGGQYVEPVYGRPRRVQGTVIAIKDGALVVDAGVPIHCAPTDARQKAEQFSVGQFVSFDVMDGASMQEG